MASEGYFFSTTTTTAAPTNVGDTTYCFLTEFSRDVRREGTADVFPPCSQECICSTVVGQQVLVSKVLCVQPMFTLFVKCAPKRTDF